MVFKKLFSSTASSNHLNDFSAVAVDMHSHLIPGIDDGAATIDDSIALARRMYDLGYKKMITTPHIQHEFFKNTPQNIQQGIQEVRAALKQENIPLLVEAAAEYLIDDGFEDIHAKGELMTFGEKYVLVELSYYNPHPNLKGIIFNLQVEGYRIILAHPERYAFWFDDFKQYEDLKNRDVYFQINLVSLSGYYPDPIKKISEKLIERGMIEFAGSDMHNMRSIDALERSIKEKSLVKLIESGRLLNAGL